MATKGKGKIPHTNTQRGKRVIVVLHSGQVILDKFVCRAKSNRWIELERHGRVAKAEIKSFSVWKGALDAGRLGVSRESLLEAIAELKGGSDV